MTEQLSGIEQVYRLAAQHDPSAGALAVISRLLGVSKQAVCQWGRKGWVPPQRALELEEYFGVDRKLLLKPELRLMVEALAEQAPD